MAISKTQFFGSLGVLILVAAGGRWPLAAQPASPFSPDERARLLAGELVRRPSRGRAGHYGGQSWQRIRAPIDEVWSTTTDIASYPRLIPTLARARRVRSRGDRQLLHMHHDYGFGTTDYEMWARFYPSARRIEFRFVEGSAEIRSGRGFLTLTPYRGDTIATWAMEIDLGRGLIQSLLGSVLTQRLLLPPRCLRDEVEPDRRSEC